MTLPRMIFVAGLALAFNFSPGVSLLAQQADNSVQNKDQSTTADKQTNVQGDRAITQQARKAVIADKDLSAYAHNIKIVTVNGSVTLKGPVKSDDEKQKVATDVASVVSPDKISNELTVKQ